MNAVGREGWDDDEPKYTVYLDAYYIGKYCETNAQYVCFVKETGHRPPGNSFWEKTEKANYPVTDVSWDDAMAYAKWAGCTLPTEAQWEKASRGPKGYVYPWGNQWDASKCRHALSRGNETTAPVDAYPQGVSGYGTYQQSGNVWEWCRDWFSEYYYKNPKQSVIRRGRQAARLCRVRTAGLLEAALGRRRTILSGAPGERAAAGAILLFAAMTRGSVLRECPSSVSGCSGMERNEGLLLLWISLLMSGRTFIEQERNSIPMKTEAFPMRILRVFRCFLLLMSVVLFVLLTGVPVHAIDLPPIPELPGEPVEENELGLSTGEFLELCKSGSPEEIRSAIERGSDVNAGDDKGMTALMWASRHNQNPDVVLALLDAGADLKATDVNGWTVLMTAASWNQNSDVVLALLKADADLKPKCKNGMNALTHAASWNQNPDVVLALLKAGADLKAKGKNGWSALMHAARYNQNSDVVLALLKTGADLEAKDEDGWSALMHAAQWNGNSDVVLALLRAGADFKVKDKNAQTALMHAARWNENPDVVLALLKAGADPKVKDKKGKRAIDFAQENEELKASPVFTILRDASK